MAYNLSTVWYTVQDQFQQFAQARGPLKPYMFNIYLQEVDDELLLEYLRMKYNPSEDVTGNPEQMDVLQYFKKTETVNAASAHTLPTGYVRFISAMVDYAGQVGTDALEHEVRYVDLDKYAKWRANEVLAPSANEPVLYIKANTIITDPTTIGSYTMWYYGQNTGASKPSLSLKYENGVTKYDSATSVELVWPQYMYPKIAERILKKLEVPVNPQLIQEKIKEYAAQ